MQQFLRRISISVARRVYASRVPISPTLQENHHGDSTSAGATLITVVCISDTHNNILPKIPNGDILLHAGDFTRAGTVAEIQAQLDWLNTLPHAHKIVIAGNNDLILDESFTAAFPGRIAAEETKGREDIDWGGVTYLQDESTTIDVRGRNITVYGSPMTPRFGHWAFQHEASEDIWKDALPEGVGILLMHGPPQWHLDNGGKGCEWLTREMWRRKPRLIVCGHIHSGRGVEDVAWDTVEKLHDDILLGDRGFGGMLMMAVGVIDSRLRYLFGGKARCIRGTVINAAVIGGGNARNRLFPATVVHI